ncbi:MAG: TetR/AcrR family transcriptional regulator [Salibacteraceae bacterium]
MGKMSTEEKILDAAENEMLSRGYEGARMRSISLKANINKGLLHYYFKSKEALMIAVFQRVFNEIFRSLAKVFASDKPIFEKIDLAVEEYTNFLIKNPRLPFFIISEMNRDPENHMNRMRKAGAEPPFKRLFDELDEGKSKGIIRKDLQTEHFMLNMMGLILFPFIAKSMILYLHNISSEEYKSLLESRKEEVKKLLIKDIKASKS